MFIINELNINAQNLNIANSWINWLPQTPEALQIRYNAVRAKIFQDYAMSWYGKHIYCCQMRKRIFINKNFYIQVEQF